MPVDTRKLKRRFDEVRSARSSVESVWDEVEQYIMPATGPVKTISGEHSVNWKRPELYDFTAIDGCQKLAANLHGSVTPPGVPWMKFAFVEPSLLEDQEAQDYLDDVVDVLLVTLQESDFDSEMASAYQEFVGAGNMFIVEEPVDEDEWKGLDFTAVPLREGFYEPDSRGGVLYFYRELEWTAPQIVSRWPEGPVPERVKTQAEVTGIAEKLKVIFAIYPRQDIQKKMERERDVRAAARKAGKKVAGPVPLAPDQRPWGYCYFLEESGEQLGEEGGYYEMPAFHVAWERTPGSIWGHGPGVIALPTVKYLNKWCETGLAAAAKAVDPATLVTEFGLLSDLDLKPGGQTVVRSMDDIKAYESGAKFDVSEQKELELRAQIRQLFFVDDLHLKDSPEMTATEARIRYELMNRLFGPTLGRVQSSGLSPMLRVALGHLSRAGKLPQPPESVRRLDPEFEIRYLGPLARARRADDVANIERAAALAAALLKMGFDEIRDAFSPTEAFKEAVMLLNAPASILLPDAEIKKRKKAREDAIAKMQEAETAKVQSEAIKNAATAQATAAPVQSVPASPTPLVAPTLS